MKKLTLIILLSITLFSQSVSAENVKIVTWNVKDIMSVADAKSRGADLKNFAETIKPDVLILQEITSKAIVEQIKHEMSLNGYSIAVSDFVQSDLPERTAFEVAYISKFPITQELEFDTTPDNKLGDPDELRIEVLEDIGIKKRRPSRGFLWIHIQDLNLTLNAVHLKSSLGRVGESDKDNAEKREVVMAYVAVGVNEDLRLFDGYAHLVAGDFNVGHSDKKKNGRSLNKDCYKNCGRKDKYDETHALLKSGLVDGLKMKNLVAGISDTTYPTYPGSPIDNIYVAGALAGKFQPAQKGTNTFGSDHLPVWTIYKAP